MTSKRKIYVTANDLRRLDDLLAELDDKTRKLLAPLKSELERAKVVASDKVPANVVTMNSRLIFRDVEDDSPMEVSLVFPEDADIERGKMSVFSPIGTALLGYAEGDTIEWTVPRGTRKVRIEKILYQPEAAGDLLA